MISKQFVNNTISLNTNGGGEEVAAWIATTRRICGPVYVFTPGIIAFSGLSRSVDSSFPVSGTHIL